jgi:hypothetical protein
VLVDAHDAFLLRPQVVHLHHRELLVQRRLAQPDRQRGGRKQRFLLLVEGEAADDLGAVAAVELALVDEALGLDLGGAGGT